MSINNKVESMHRNMDLITSAAKPRGYKTFFMFNEAEHEIYPVNKYII